MTWRAIIISPWANETAMKTGSTRIARTSRARVCPDGRAAPSRNWPARPRQSRSAATSAGHNWGPEHARPGEADQEGADGDRGQRVGDRGADPVDGEHRGPALGEAHRQGTHGRRVPDRGAEADQRRADQRAGERPG